MKRIDFIKKYIDKFEIKEDILGYNYNVSVDLINNNMSAVVDNLQIKLNNVIEKVLEDENKKLTKLEVINLIGDNSLRKDYFEEKYFIEINIMKLYDYLNERFEINKGMTKVYRIECEEKGIYSYLSGIDKSLSDVFDFDDINQTNPKSDEHLPAICLAINYIDRSIIKYACDSKEQLISWFPKEMIQYIQENAPNSKIVEYEIEDSKVLTSTKQAVFISGTEIKIKEFKIEDLFKVENKNKLKNK